MAAEQPSPSLREALNKLQRDLHVEAERMRAVPHGNSALTWGEAAARIEGLAKYAALAGQEPSPSERSPETLREQLAALAHDQWSGWMRYLFSRCTYPDPRGVKMPAEWAERWMRQMNTPYAELSEAEKDSDRKEADRVLEMLRDAPAPSSASPLRARVEALAEQVVRTHMGWSSAGTEQIRETRLFARLMQFAEALLAESRVPAPDAGGAR